MNDDSAQIRQYCQPALLAEVYNLLALCMRYPDTSFIDNDFFDVYKKFLDALDLSTELAALENWLRTDQQQLQTLQIEYTRLFINTAPRLIAPPYGSYYLDGDFSLQGKSTEKTRDFYRQHAYDILDTSEPADHIRLELEFLSALAKEHNEDAEKIFLGQLFRPWFNKFYQKIINENTHPFYRGSILLIDIFTKEEQ